MFPLPSLFFPKKRIGTRIDEDDYLALVFGERSVAKDYGYAAKAYGSPTTLSLLSETTTSALFSELRGTLRRPKPQRRVQSVSHDSHIQQPSTELGPNLQMTDQQPLTSVTSLDVREQICVVRKKVHLLHCQLHASSGPLQIIFCPDAIKDTD